MSPGLGGQAIGARVMETAGSASLSFVAAVAIEGLRHYPLSNSSPCLLRLRGGSRLRAR